MKRWLFAATIFVILLPWAVSLLLCFSAWRWHEYRAAETRPR